MNARLRQWMWSGLAGFPLLLPASIYLFVLRARWLLGHWPSPSDGMAKHMAFKVHYDLTVNVLILAPLIAIGVLIAAFVCRRSAGFRSWSVLWTLVASWVLVCVLFTTDPGGFILWFAD